MSIGPGIPPQLDGELARAKEQEADAKAAAYARGHPEGADGEPRPGVVSRLLTLLQLRRG